MLLWTVFSIVFLIKLLSRCCGKEKDIYPKGFNSEHSEQF